MSRNRQTEKQKEQLAALDSVDDEQIDTSDIPEVKSFAGGVRGLFSTGTRQISIRLNAADLLAARKLAEAKGMAYQTYIKMLLHEALQRQSSNG